MAYWKQTIRKIRGKRRLVKVHSGRYGSGRVRVVAHRNYSYRHAPKRLRIHRKRGGHVTPDSKGKYR